MSEGRKSPQVFRALPHLPYVDHSQNCDDDDDDDHDNDDNNDDQDNDADDIGSIYKMMRKKFLTFPFGTAMDPFFVTAA